jgi:cellulose synthase/poly-beta-1,6-N-acetylglucosamine synthase-like glycosyltransferase
LVIYDAEYVPEVDQLKKAVIAFRKASPQTICIQAKLNFYNVKQNLLTRLFTAEYSLWFDLVLPGLQSLNAPIPLGGTSNHFKTEVLREVSGWDAFNVTEDCDLGIRLAKRGYRTAIVESTTYEEANSDTINWYNQRSRWIKGYIQSYMVHMRDPLEFIRKGSVKDFFIFQFVVGGKILSIFINPVIVFSNPKAYLHFGMEKVKNVHVINDKWILELLTTQNGHFTDSDSVNATLAARYK